MQFIPFVKIVIIKNTLTVEGFLGIIFLKVNKYIKFKK